MKIIDKIKKWFKRQEEIERTKREADEEIVRKLNNGELNYKNYFPK